MIKNTRDTRVFQFPVDVNGRVPAPPTASRRPAARGDSPIPIDGKGVSYYHASPIGRKGLVRLFAPPRTRDETGAPSPDATVGERREAPTAHPVYYELVLAGTEEKVGHDTVSGIRSSLAFLTIGKLDGNR